MAVLPSAAKERRGGRSRPSPAGPQLARLKCKSAISPERYTKQETKQETKQPTARTSASVFQTSAKRVSAGVGSWPGSEFSSPPVRTVRRAPPGQAGWQSPSRGAGAARLPGERSGAAAAPGQLLGASPAHPPAHSEGNSCAQREPHPGPPVTTTAEATWAREPSPRSAHLESGTAGHYLS